MEKFQFLLIVGLVIVGIIFFLCSRSGKSNSSESTDTTLIEVGPDENPWGIPLIDLRPFTHTIMATSENPVCAENSVSYGNETGESFFEDLPTFENRTECQLRYSSGGAEKLLPGVLFTPDSMDQKWAIFCDESRIVFVRSWMREVVACADFEYDEGDIIITALHGDFQTGSTGEFLVAELDYLIRSHVLREDYPVPVHELTTDQALGILCFAPWGNLASFAARFPLPEIKTDTPLVSNSRLHIALARGEKDRVNQLLDQGYPMESLAQDGLTTMHWASVAQEGGMVDLLLDRGASIDMRSRQGATVLMNEAQGGDLETMKDYLARGADPNATDHRGFTALHRSAEMGAEGLVQMLLEAGADPHAEAEGHTPVSLAKSQNHDAIAALLEKN